MTRLLLTPLRRIATPKGDVLHAMKATDPGFAGFGEAYFSLVDKGAVKGWKRHSRMVLNLVVASGRIRFHIRDPEGSPRSIDLSPDTPETHQRLTVPPGFWMAFEGVADGPNMVLNLASIGHDPDEAESVALDTFALDRDDRRS